MAMEAGKWTDQELWQEADDLFIEDYKAGRQSSLDDLKGCYGDGAWDMNEQEFKKLCDLYFGMWA